MANTNKAIKFIDKTESRTARCPAMCISETGAARLAACTRGANRAIHSVLLKIKEALFDTINVVTKDGTKHISIFDIYATGLPKEYLNANGKYMLIRNGAEYSANSSLGLYPTRELFNPKSPVLGDRQEFLDIINETMTTETGLAVDTPSQFWNECVCSKVDGMMKGYASRVSMLDKPINGKTDMKWKDAVSVIAKKSGLGLLEYSIIARVLTNCGPQTMNAINGEMPSLKKVFGKENKKKLKMKVYDEELEVSFATFDRLSEQAKAIYEAAYVEFKKSVTENVPNPKKLIPLTVPEISVDRNSTINSTYFDWKVTLRGIPSGTVELLIRAHSDKGTNYYPENIFALSKEFPKGTVVFNGEVDVQLMVCKDMNHPGNPPMTLNIPYEVETKVPSLDKEDAEKVDLEKTVGIDAGIAVAGLVTSLKAKDLTANMLDWHEAVHAYYQEHSQTNLFTLTKTQSTKNDLKRLVDEYEAGNYNLIAMLTIGLRDGSPANEKFNWMPVADPCANMFAWMLKRTNADGTYFYNDRQRAIIGHTKLWRRFIRQLIANRRHYFFEQAKWDRIHDTMTEVFSKNAPIASELNAEYAKLTDKIRAESTFILSCELLNSEAFAKMDIVAMENLNLNDVKKNSKFTSLYATVKNNWHMNPKDGYKVKASKNSNTAVIDFGRIVTPEDVARMCKDTQHWNAPYSIVVEGTIATIQCEPTEEGLRCRDTEWADDYLKKAMHIALLKHDAERILTKKGILYKEVSAKNTSQTCHECGYDKCAKKDMKLTQEQCLTKKLNYRDGRVFVCGNPNCKLHGIIQNADWNASFCIRNRVKFKGAASSKSMSSK